MHLFFHALLSHHMNDNITIGNHSLVSVHILDGEINDYIAMLTEDNVNPLEPSTAPRLSNNPRNR
jgi:hypothetical protein